MTRATDDVNQRRKAESTSVVGLPDWITYPLVAMDPSQAEDLVSAASARLVARSAG